MTIGLLTIGMGMSAQVATDGTTASGISSTAMGAGTTASGDYSTAMGNGPTASGVNSTAMGGGTTASGSSSTAMGNRTTASGSSSTAMGNTTTASGVNSTAMGIQTTASGVNSTAMGNSTTASDYSSLSIGQFNKSNATVTSGGSATQFSKNNTAFVIGNGTSSNHSDAFKVMFNGDATVSKDLTVNGVVNTSSDARLKTDIMSLGGTLTKLLLIDGKSYTTKKDGRQTIGVLAQDIQEVFPELVTTDDNDMLAVNYQGLVPVLINALKEQQVEIDKLKEQEAKVKEQEVKLQAQEERLARLEAMIEEMNK